MLVPDSPTTALLTEVPSLHEVAEVLLQGIAAVSYTHLDGYKRQAVSVTARGNQSACALQAMHDGNGVLLHLLDHDRGGFQALACHQGLSLIHI